MKKTLLILLCIVLVIAGFVLAEVTATNGQLPLVAKGKWRAMNNGQAPTPPMGWSSWNTFKLDIYQERLEGIAEAMVSSGLRDAGYVQLNIDDGWWLNRRTSDGRLLINTRLFPDAQLPSGENSFRPFTDYLHSMGLKAGIYSDAGRNTCGNLHADVPSGSIAEREVGTWDFSQQDLAMFFDEWGFDYLKVDACGLTKFRPWEFLHRGLVGKFRSFPPLTDEQIRGRYTQLGHLLADSSRDVTFSICLWGVSNVNHWGSEAGNLWRTSDDIRYEWKSMLHNYESAVELELYAGPGRWNDPDMLAVGLGDFSVEHIEQARSHFSLWAMLAAPLILGNDLANMPGGILDLLIHPGVIAINQDPAGHQASRVYESGEYDVLVKTLSAPAGEARKALLVLNRREEAMTVRLPLGYTLLTSVTGITDVWTGEPLETGEQGIELTVPAHGVRLLEVGGEHRLGEHRFLTELPGQVHIVQSHSKTARILSTEEIRNLGIEDLDQALAIHPNSMLQWQLPPEASRLEGQFSAGGVDKDNVLVLGFYGDGRLLSRYRLDPQDTKPMAFSHDLASIDLLEITVEATSDHDKTRVLLLDPIITYNQER